MKANLSYAGKLVCLLLLLYSSKAGAQSLTITDSVVHTYYGEAIGSITLTIDSGQAPFTFHWSNNDTTNQITGLGRGEYSVTVTDAADSIIKHYNIAYYVFWDSFSHVYESTPHQLICTNDFSGNLAENYAFGMNALRTDSDGFVSFHFGEGAYYKGIVGLVSDLNFDDNSSLIPLMIMSDSINVFDGDSEIIIPKGIYLMQDEPYYLGDFDTSMPMSITISRKGDSIALYKNDIVIISDTFSYFPDFHPIAIPLRNNARIKEVVCDFDTLRRHFSTPLAITDSVVHTLYGEATGSITITVTSGQAPSYLWSNNDTTHQITGLSKGDYSVTITNTTDTLIKHYNIAYYVSWSEFQNVNETSSHALECTQDLSDMQNIFENHALGANVLKTDSVGFISFHFNQGAYYKGLVGLIQQDGNGNFIPVLILSDTIHIFDGDSNRIVSRGVYSLQGDGNPNYLGDFDSTVPVGITIFKRGDSVIISKNDVVIFSDTSSYFYNFYPIAIPFRNNALIKYVVCDFGTLPDTTAPPQPLTISDSVVHTLYGEAIGSITVNVTSGQAPYIYHWSSANGGTGNNDTTHQITGLSKGEYTVTITNATDTLVKHYNINYYVSWDTLMRIAETGSHELITVGTPNPEISSDSVMVGFGANEILPDSSGIITFNFSSDSTFGGAVGLITNVFAEYDTTPPFELSLIAILPDSDYAVSGISGIYLVRNMPFSNLEFLGTREKGSPLNLKIAAHGDSITIFKNDIWSTTYFYQRHINLSPMILPLVENSRVQSATVNFGVPVKALKTVIQIVPAENVGAAGNVYVTVSRGTPPYNYQWSNSATTDSLLNVRVGEYTLTVTDNGNQTVTKNIFLGGYANWDTLNNISVISHELVVGGTPPNDTSDVFAFAIGTNELQPNNSGIISFDLSPDSTFFGILGLLTNPFQTVGDTGQTQFIWVGIIPDSALSSVPTGGIYIAHNMDIGEGNVDFIGERVPGVPLNIKIYVKGDSFTVVKNDIESFRYSYPRQLSLNPFVASFLENSRVKSVTLNFGERIKVNADITNIPCGSSSGGGIAVTPISGVPPYSYQWSTSASDSVITGLGVGEYFVTISDDIGNSAVKSERVGYEVTWDTIYRVIRELSGSLRRDTSNTDSVTVGFALAANTLYTGMGEMGWLDYSVESSISPWFSLESIQNVVMTGFVDGRGFAIDSNSEGLNGTFVASFGTFLVVFSSDTNIGVSFVGTLNASGDNVIHFERSHADSLRITLNDRVLLESHYNYPVSIKPFAAFFSGDSISASLGRIKYVAGSFCNDSALYCRDSLDPVAIIASHDTVCAGTQITLTATSYPGATMEWFANACGDSGVLVGTGDTIKVTPDSSTTFYVRNKSFCPWVSELVYSRGVVRRIITWQEPEPPIAPSSQIFQNYLSHTFVFDSIMAGTNGDQIEWSTNNGFNNSTISSSPSQVNLIVNNGDTATIWLRSRNSGTSCVSGYVSTRAMNSRCYDPGLAIFNGNQIGAIEVGHSIDPGSGSQNTCDVLTGNVYLQCNTTYTLRMYYCFPTEYDPYGPNNTGNCGSNVDHWIVTTYYNTSSVTVSNTNAITNQITLSVGTTANFYIGEPINFATSIGGLTACTTYYVLTKINGTVFTVTATNGGFTPVALTNASGSSEGILNPIQTSHASYPFPITFTQPGICTIQLRGVDANCNILCNWTLQCPLQVIVLPDLTDQTSGVTLDVPSPVCLCDNFCVSVPSNYNDAVLNNLVFHFDNSSDYYGFCQQGNPPICSNENCTFSAYGLGWHNGETHTVTLSFSDENTPSCASTVSEQITVGPPVSFTSNLTGCRQVSFNASVCSNATVTDWQWYFGDGTMSTLEDPVHTYPVSSSSATYTVTLTATINNCGTYTPSTQTVTIAPAPVVNITASNEIVCNDQSGTSLLTAVNGSGTAYSTSVLEWSTHQNPVTNPISVSSGGTYSVTVTDPTTQCSASASATVEGVNCCEWTLTNSRTFENATSYDLLTDAGLSALVVSGKIVGPAPVILINGSLKINTAGFGFKGCHVLFSKDAYLELGGGNNNTFEVLGSLFEPCTADMWQGIKMPFANNEITVANATISGTTYNSTIIGAKLAIDAQANGLITCSDAFFLGDYNGIKITSPISGIFQTGQVSNSTVTNCEFDGDFPHTYNSLLYPNGLNPPVTNATYGARAIEVKDVVSITIGNGNIIKNYNVGLSAFRSGVNINNCIFRNIYNPLFGRQFSYIGNYLISGTAVFSQGQFWNGNRNYLNISQNDKTTKNFENCITGIKIDMGDLDAQKNYFYYVVNGVSTANCILSTLHVINNTFDQYNYGVSMNANPYAINVRVVENEFFTRSIPNVNSYYTAIQYNDIANASVVRADIGYNYIHDAKMGIYVSNSSAHYTFTSPDLYNSNFNLYNNYFNYPNAQTGVGTSYGIGIFRTKGLLVDKNEHLGYSPTVGTDANHTQTIGISSFESPNVIYHCNEVKNSVCGFAFGNSCRDSRMIGNHMGTGTPCSTATSLGYGILLYNFFGGGGEIGPQAGVFSGVCTDWGNQFYPTFSYAGTYTIYSDGLLSQFRYRSNALAYNYCPPNTNLSFLNASNTILFTPFSGLDGCTSDQWLDCSHNCGSRSISELADGESESIPSVSNLYLPEDVAREEEIAQGMLDSVADITHADITIYKMQQYLFWKLKKQVDTASVESLASDTLRDFYNLHKDSVIGKLLAISELAAELGDTSLLSDTMSLLRDKLEYLLRKNDSIQTVTIYQANEKKMNELTFRFMSSDSGITKDQLGYITGLAFSCPMVEGDAVYTARSYYRALVTDTVFFNDSLICNNQSGKKEWDDEKQPIDSIAHHQIRKEITVFPNPASTMINVVTSLETDEAGVLEIFNITGIKMKEIKIKGGITTNAVQIDRLNNGVYSYRFVTDKQFVFRGKLVIAR